MDAAMPAIVELTPLTPRGWKLLDALETKTGLTPIQDPRSVAGKTYHLAGSANVEGFQAALDRTEPNWARHLMFRVLSQTA
jgi:hypothetical protein